MVEGEIPGSKSYYAIEYRRGDDGSDSNAGAFRRDWDSYDLGIRSDRVTVYLVEPDLYAANADDLGDANLAAVLDPGGSYSSPDGRLTVSFNSVVDASHMNASVTVKTPQPPAPLTFLSAEGTTARGSTTTCSAYLFPYATDQGAPLATTYYGVDDRGCNGQTRDCAVYSPDGFTIAGDGVHDVTYFSTDVSGASEIVRHATIRIDRTPPATTAGIAATDGGPRVLTLGATDALSGVRETDYDLDGAGFKPYHTPLEIAGPGAHTVRFRSVDIAGNLESPRQVEVDGPAPRRRPLRPRPRPRRTSTPGPAPVDVPAQPVAAPPAQLAAPPAPLTATVTATPARIARPTAGR